MANSPVITSLPKYVEENRLPLISKAVLGAKTPSLLTLQTGVKGETALNLLQTSVVFGDGADCGWDEAGTATLTQRIIKPVIAKVNMAFCDKKLIGKWAQSQVRIAAGLEKLPFEEEFLNSVNDGIKAGIEKMVWQGDSANRESRVECDGFLKLLGADSSVIDVTFTSGANVYQRTLQVLDAIPGEVYDKASIFMGADYFRSLVQNLVAANLYHYDANDGEMEIVLPGTNIKVYGVHGLDGTKKIVAGPRDEMFYGVDFENDEEVFDLFYSKDNREFRLAVEFACGVQYAFGDHMVLGAEA